MKTKLMPYALFGAILVGEGLVGLSDPVMGRAALLNSARFLWQVLTIVPCVLVLLGLFDAWVPRRFIETNIGPASGGRGVALSLLLGTAAAGPLYAAFPIALSLQEKGARRANIVIFLGSWATIKIPMLLLESSFVGIRFAVLRLVLTLPGLVAIGFLMEHLLAPRASKAQDSTPLPDRPWLPAVEEE